MNRYEITYITNQETSDPAIEIIESSGGKIVSSQVLGLKKFVYPIKKKNSGYYFTAIFESEPRTIEILEKKLRLNDEVIRFLIVYKKTQEIILPKIEKTAEAKEEILVEKILEKLEEKPLKTAKVKKEKIEKEKLKKEEIKEEKKRLVDLDKELEKILME